MKKNQPIIFLILFILSLNINLNGQCSVSVSSAPQNTYCAGSCDGFLISTASGGTAPYSYNLNGSINGTGMFSTLCAGTYQLIVTDFMGCTDTSSVSIGSPPTVNVNISPVYINCGTCAIMNTTTSGGVPGYAYSWTGPMAFTSMMQNPVVCTSGFYTVTVTDMYGCTGTDVTPVVLPGPSTPIPGLVVNGVVSGACGGGLGTITLNLSGNSGPFNFNWTNGANTQNLSSLVDGPYGLTITDSLGNCYNNSYLVATSSPSPIPGLATSANMMDAFCQNTSDGFIDLILTGGIGPFSFLWSNDSITEDIYYLNTGAYSVYISDTNNHCNAVNFALGQLDTCASVIASLYSDGNQDCSYNGFFDFPLSSQLIYIYPGPYISSTNIYGQASFVGMVAGNYYIQHFGDAIHIPFCNDSIPFTLGTSYTPFMFDTVVNGCHDAATSLHSNGFVPGFNCNLDGHLNNWGSPAFGTMYVVLDTILDFVSSVPAPVSIVGDTIFYDVNSINVSETCSLIVHLAANPAYLGYITTNQICYVPTSNDIHPTNNCFTYHRTDTSSFDPNGKSVSPPGIGNPGNIMLQDSILTYLIQFQNTGTSPAVNIIINDTLSDKLDLNSFEMIGSSHPYELRIQPDGAAEWRFLNIMLADSNSNEPASHGWLQYRMKQSGANQVGDEIKNTAYIFFDFNSAIITNTTLNTIYIPTNSIIENEGARFFIYPNPVDQQLTISISEWNNNSSFEIYNSLGELMQTGQLVSEKTLMDVAYLVPGIYFIRFSDLQSSGTSSFIKK